MDGKRHREDGPAITYRTGAKLWFYCDRLHRFSGPAVELPNGEDEWWISGKKLPTEEVRQWIGENNISLRTELGQMAFKLRWA